MIVVTIIISIVFDLDNYFVGAASCHMILQSVVINCVTYFKDIDHHGTYTLRERTYVCTY